MGKAAKFKKLRKLAAQLPAVNYLTNVPGEKKQGKELKKMGVTEVGGKPVIDEAWYIENKQVEKGLNHHKKMKQAYKKNGLVGVTSYGNAVLQFVQQQKKKEDEHNLSE